MNKKIVGSFLRLSLSLFLAPALWSTPALGATPPMQPDPAVAAKADSQFEAYDKCQDGTIDLTGGAKSAKFSALAGVDTGNYLIFHQACLVSMPGSTQTCEQMGRGKAGCLADVEYARLITAIVDNGDAAGVCAKFHLTVKPGKHANHAKKCDFLISALRRGSLDLCGEALAAGVIQKTALPDCRKNVVYFNGDPERCGTDLTCRERAALLSGLRSKNFRTCALSPWCRAMTTRKAETCDAYVVQANKSFCDAVAKVVVPLKKAKAARDAKLEEQKLKQKKVFKKGEPMHVMDPSKTSTVPATPATPLTSPAMPPKIVTPPKPDEPKTP